MAAPQSRKSKKFQPQISTKFQVKLHLGMRKLPLTAAEELLEIIMRRYERVSTMLPPTTRSKTGANCWATRLPSAPCSTACCTTGTC